MGDTYHYNIPGIVIHISHILVGLWLVYIGYMKITDKKLEEVHYKILLILGIVLFLYFLSITYKNLGKSWNYAFGIPNYVIFSTHLFNAILFILLGLKYITISNIISLYLIVSGSLAGLYHAHLMLVQH